jgi:ABC-type polysaccharide/polyol phosphate transport system ATPase subunit
MLPNGTIEADHVWKRFKGDSSRQLLRDKIQGFTSPGTKRKRGHRWALRDVAFHIEPGESVSLLGTNGSGKSTLLKILNRVMYPYAGDVNVCGRVGALIEVRAGIHPELSGRENIYLAGSFLGLKREEVARRFDAIVDFAELEHAIDRQVKFYSSGMQMRIGFAVAAFLEPDVLLVDEVLAVGDASFQQKCLDRMRQVMSQGTTLVLVSHDLAAVEATCRRGIYLKDGVVQLDGPMREVMGAYRRTIEEKAHGAVRSSNEPVHLVSTTATDADGGIPKTQEPLKLRFSLTANAFQRGRFFFGLTQGTASPIILLGRMIQIEDGALEVECTIESLPLPRGRYYLWCGMFDGDESDLLGWQPAMTINVSGPELDHGPAAIVRLAPIHVGASWAMR